jgi:hypothetical protein
MNNEIEPAPLFLDRRKDGIHRGGVGDVTMAGDKAFHLRGQRLNPAFERVALIGEGELRPLLVAGARDTPGNRPVVGDAEDQATLAPHQPCVFRH